MTENESDRRWASEHFRDYFLHRLSEEHEDRMHSILSSVENMKYDFDQAEVAFIREGLTGKLNSAGQADFETYYVNGDESARIKVQLERCLMLPKAAGSKDRPAPTPISAKRAPVSFYALAAAALALITIGGVLLYRDSREITKLESELIKLQKALEAKQSPPVPEPKPERAQNQNPIPNRRPEERQAGENTPDGIILRPSNGLSRISVSSLPARLTWKPVPNVRVDYKIRIRAADGQEQTSPALSPQDYAIGYDVQTPGALPLPWDLTILDPAAKTLSHYTISKK